MNQPDPLPPAVHDFVLWADEALRDNDEALAVVHRIATAPNMQRRVWKPLKDGGATSGDLWLFMTQACVEALNFSRETFLRKGVITRRERDDLAKRYSETAELCRAETLSKPELAIAATHFETLARVTRTLGPVIGSSSKNDQARAYVRVLAIGTKHLFGRVMHRTVATVATAALDQKITSNQVKNWCTALRD
jgi:hypothetical protein